MIHNTAVSQFIPPGMIQKTAGTWTPTVSSGKTFDRRTAGDASFTLLIPILIPSNSVALAGSKLASIDVFYNITTAAADDFATVELELQSLSSVGAQTAAAVTTSIDSGHDSAAERKATGEHKMTVTLSDPAWIDDDQLYVLQLVVDAAATTIFDLVGARANFTARL